MKIEIKTWKALDDLMKAKKPFVLTANGHNGGTAEILDWDGKELTDDKISEAVDRLKDKSYDEIDDLLVKGIENIKTTNEADQMTEEKIESGPPKIKTNFGYATAISISYIFIIFGIIVCIAALLFKIILKI
jgi:hypothetical protein